MTLAALTVTGGFLDAVSYLGLGHVFTANMTGNIVLVGFAAAGTPGFSVLASLCALAFFVAGAILAGRLDRRINSTTPCSSARSSSRSSASHWPLSSWRR